MREDIIIFLGIVVWTFVCLAIGYAWHYITMKEEGKL